MRIILEVEKKQKNKIIKKDVANQKPVINRHEKIDIKGFTALAPLPVVMVSVGNMEKANIITIAWCGIINSNKPMLYISVRPERYSYKMIKESKNFVVNFVNEKLCYAMDYVGVRSGTKIDKFKEMKLTKGESKIIESPYIVESPCNIECKVVNSIKLGTHEMFIAEIVNVKIDKNLKNKKGRLCFDKLKLVSHVHGDYFVLGKKVGTIGYSFRKSK